MRSIRLSLVMSFLALLAAALGLIGVLANRTMLQALLERNERDRVLLRVVHESRVREAEESLDRGLYRRATTLAKVAKSQSGTSILQEFREPIVLLSGLFGQTAYSALPLFPLQPMWGLRLDNPLTQHLRFMSFVTIHDAELIMSAPDPEDTSAKHAREYYQVYNERGIPTQHSEVLPEGVFALDQKTHDELEPFVQVYDWSEIASGPRLRRITLRVPIPAYRAYWGTMPRPGPRRENRPPVPRTQPPPPPASDRPPPSVAKVPTFFIQCATETDIHVERIQRYRDDLQRDLANLDVESQRALAHLSRQLWLVGLLTFAATLIGGFWLVRLGLSPLQRLTKAVSQVSERDFRLPVGERPMPRELTPIVKRLSETLDQLRRAFEREKQAAADISHELRTPLSALLATTDVALKKDRTTDEYRAALKDCRASGRQMSQLVERLLALARLDAGVDPLQRKDVEVTEVAEVCAEMIRPLAEAKGLQLRYHEAPPVTVRTDPDKLHEVLSNLLHNAIEYNREHGSIDVRVVRDNGSVVLEVADTGIGISPAQRERIFERFYRADPSRQADGLHAGLGLAITKSYVELMGGRISVDSHEGAGSTFRIELPAGQGR